MSHFTVLVIGDNPEIQLEPYHEFECTGIDDQYVQEVDKTEEVLAQIDKSGSLEAALEYYGLENKIIAEAGEIDTENDHKFGYAIVRDGKLVRAVTRTNPNARWDWCVLGGRWRGYFKLKPGISSYFGVLGEPSWGETEPPQLGECDQARKKDIDFEAMRDRDGEAVRKRHRNFVKATDVKPTPISSALSAWAQRADHKNFEHYRDRAESDHLTMDEARTLYRAQPIPKAVRESKELGYIEDIETYLVSEDEYVQRYRNLAIVTFAIVKDGKWAERGKMGWWGMATDETSIEEWANQVNTMVDGLPDDTLLSVYDCHI